MRKVGTDEGEVVTDQSARQGPKGRPVLMVLIGSLVLLGIYMVSLLVWSGSDSAPGASQEASREVTDPATTSSTNTRGSPVANPAYPAPADRAANPNATGGGATPNGGPAR